MKKKIVIVLDSFEYKNKENELYDAVSDIGIPVFVYTKYENALTEIFQRTKFVGGFLTHISYWLMSIIYAFKLLLKRRSNDIVFINPIVGIFFCLFTRLSLAKYNITIAGFLFEKKRNKIYYTARKLFVSFCYKHVSKVIVYGKNEVDLYSNEFPFLKNKIHFVQYGRDYTYKHKEQFQYDRKYIASGGRSNRNYKTLCEAYDNSDISREYKCLIATRPECVDDSMQKSEVEFIYGITLNQFGSFIKGADLFVLPLLNTELSAGHMAMLEAMSVSVPILVTDIPSIRNYVTEDHVFFYKPDDANDLSRKMTCILNDIKQENVRKVVKQAKELYEKEYSFNALLRRVVKTSLL